MQNMLEGVHPLALMVDEIQDAANVHLLERIEQWGVGLFRTVRIRQTPASVGAVFFDLEVLVFARFNPLIDPIHEGFEFLFQGVKMILDRLLKNRESREVNQLVFVSPLLIVYQVVFKAAEADATRESTGSIGTAITELFKAC